MHAVASPVSPALLREPIATVERGSIRNLIKLMKQKKAEAIEKYGYYKWEI